MFLATSILTEGRRGQVFPLCARARLHPHLNQGCNSLCSPKCSLSSQRGAVISLQPPVPPPAPDTDRRFHCLCQVQTTLLFPVGLKGRGRRCRSTSREEKKAHCCVLEVRSERRAWCVDCHGDFAKKLLFCHLSARQQAPDGEPSSAGSGHPWHPRRAARGDPSPHQGRSKAPARSQQTSGNQPQPLRGQPSPSL